MVSYNVSPDGWLLARNLYRPTAFLKADTPSLSLQRASYWTTARKRKIRTKMKTQVQVECGIDHSKI